MTRTIAVLPIGRATFDVAFAESNLAEMLAALGRGGHKVIGPETLLFDAEATRTALAQALSKQPDFLAILQVTFTDAAMTREIAERYGGPLGIWAIPEPRSGGRLRLNSFCGLNLAGHALGRANREFSWLYCSPDDPAIDEQLADFLAGRCKVVRAVPQSEPAEPSPEARAIAASLADARIARIGEPPPGFDTCAYDRQTIRDLVGVDVAEIPLSRLFETARSGDRSQQLGQLRKEVSDLAGSLDNVDTGQLQRSLGLKLALDEIRTAEDFDAFAIRCWPETFTEYGGAVCGPVSLLSEARTPCACEADVYGALTQLVLQRIAGAPVFLADLVDLDARDNTGVVWHCGQAPLSMRNGTVNATIHSNRKMPLLFEFALKPGRVTFARISQARGAQQMVIAGGEMLDRPKSFTGTSGVVRFDTPAAAMAEKIMASGLEHHMALVYGEHRAMLGEVASALGLPVLEL
jgi:hypothetical protein